MYHRVSEKYRKTKDKFVKLIRIYWDIFDQKRNSQGLLKEICIIILTIPLDLIVTCIIKSSYKISYSYGSKIRIFNAILQDKPEKVAKI